MSTVSGTFHELLSSREGIGKQDQKYQRFTKLSVRLLEAFASKTSTMGSTSTSTPSTVAQNSSYRAEGVSSPHKESLTRPFRSSTQSPITHGTNFGDGMLAAANSNQQPLPDYLSQDFAMSNNYEGLFEAVELMGVQSSDSVEDLFNQTHLEHYSTFDDSWPGTQSPAASNNQHQWQTHQRSLFDVE